MAKHSRTKGVRGELEVAAIFRAHGFDCDRVPNSGGLRLKGDLYGTVPVHVESKYQEVWRLPLWIAQAKRESEGKPWVVAFRANRTPWYATLPLAELVSLLARDLPCPRCGNEPGEGHERWCDYEAPGGHSLPARPVKGAHEHLV